MPDFLYKYFIIASAYPAAILRRRRSLATFIKGPCVHPSKHGEPPSYPQIQPVMTMKNSATLMLFALGLLLLGACKSAEMTSDAGDAPPPPPMTMEQELVAKHIEATGGLSAIQAIESVVMAGELYMPAAGMNMPITLTVKRPSNMHVHVKVPAMNMEVTNGFDGETAWEDNPMQGGLRKLDDDQVARFKEQADLDGILVDHEAKGYSVEYAGDADIKGTATKKLKVLRPDSSEIFIYLNAETFVQVKTESEAPNPMTGGTAKVETFMSDYRPVNGVQMPFGLEVVMDGQTFQTITFTQITANGEIDDTIFMYPKK